ncbi:MAG: phosphatidylglycerophosphatase A [Alphaproteobacteria bacterium TMED93]|nr:MAG: phosphatidylglycerophosphatase A [Alphaproteobacteria bacterium TMED93]
MKSNTTLFIFSYLFCTIFKIGNIKYMPGTLGSIIGVVAGIFLKNTIPITYYVLIILLIFLIAIITINIYQTKVGKKDRSEIIIDEFIGQQIPIFFIELNILNIVMCFILFRFFDILKIFPTNYIDRNFKTSYGIIADDVVAGFQALGTIYLIKLFI